MFNDKQRKRKGVIHCNFRDSKDKYIALLKCESVKIHKT